MPAASTAGSPDAKPWYAESKNGMHDLVLSKAEISLATISERVVLGICSRLV